MNDQTSPSPEPGRPGDQDRRGGIAVLAIVVTIAIMTCGALGIALGAIFGDFRKGFWISSTFGVLFAAALGWFAMRDRRSS